MSSGWFPDLDKPSELYCHKIHLVIAIVLLVFIFGAIIWKSWLFFYPKYYVEKITSSESKGVLVRYVIECDHIYTGSPTTYEKYEGEKFYQKNERTTNGLRVDGIFPEHANFFFIRNNGEWCTLHVPVKRSPVTALVTCGGINRFLLSVFVKKEKDGTIFIQAVP